MKTLVVKKGHLLNCIHIPSSKSYANRVLILCSLQKDSPTIKNLPKASDVTNLLRCLKDVGLKFEQKGNDIKFQNSFPNCELDFGSTLLVGEGGTTARFLAVMLLLGKNKYDLKLGRRLKERPWGEFIKLARSLGAFAELRDDLLTLKGPISLPEEIEVDCSLTTQFASAFELILDDKNHKIIPTNLNSSQSYFGMTQEIKKKIFLQEVYEVPRDWSSASYPMAFAALNQEIEFPGLKCDPFQADSKFLDILKKFDCVTETPTTIKVRPINKNLSLKIDVSDCLDLVPTLSYFLAHVDGTHTLSGVSNLIHKESNRLEEVLKLLKIFEREAFFQEDSIVIVGTKKVVRDQKNLTLPDDHRMVMSGALYLLHHTGGHIGPVDSVEKSFPGFFDIISF